MYSDQALPAPGSLRPRTVMELLDASFRVYRDNFVPFITIAALLFIPGNIITALIGLSNPFLDPTALTDFSSTVPTDAQFEQLGTGVAVACFGALLSIVIGLIQTTVLNGVITHMTSEREFGRTLTAGEAWRETSGRMVALGGGYVVFYLVMIGLSIPIGFVSVLCGITAVLFAIVAYLGVTMGSFLAPVVMLENAPPGGALMRGHALAKGRFWTVLGVTALLGLITVAISFAFTSVISVLLLSNPDQALSFGGQIINVLASTAMQVIVAPILPIALTLLYLDTRIRSEGLDIALRTLGEDARPRDLETPPTGDRFLNGKDAANIAILAGAALVIVLVFGAALFALFSSVFGTANGAF